MNQLIDKKLHENLDVRPFANHFISKTLFGHNSAVEGYDL